MDDALITRNMTMALLAIFLCPLSLSSSRMADSPNGVAAFPIPSMFATRLSEINPAASLLGGTPGNKNNSAFFSLAVELGG